MDNYKIGVSIALANGVSPVLATIMGDLARLGARVKSVETGFGGWKTALGGVAAVLATGAIVNGVIAIAKAGGEVNHQLELMKIAGMDNANIQLAYAQALQTSGAVTTTTLSENLAHIRELRYAFGETTAAVAHLDEISKSNAVLNSITDKTGAAGGHDQVWALVKSLEMKGETFDPAAFSSYVNTMTKVVEATGGKVTPEMFMSTFKYGRTAMLGWDESFIGGALPRLMQSWASGGGGGGAGSGGPGNALMSAFAKVVQGQMPKTAAEEFERLDLAPGGVKHITGSTESQIPGGIKGANLFMANPYEWVQQVLMPALAAKGITGQNDIIAEISRLFPVRTASAAITEQALQGRFHEGANSPFEKDIALQKGAMGLPGYEELIKNDYPTILKAFNQQFENLLQTLGSPMMQPGGAAISALSALAGVMASLAQSAGSGNLKSLISIMGEVGSIIYKIDTFGLRVLSFMTGFGAVFSVLGGLPWEAISGGLAAVNRGLAGLAGVLDKVQHLLGIGGAAAKEADQTFNDRFDALKHPMRFDPGISRTKVTPISLSLSIDGRVLAQSISEQLEQLYEHATGSPNYNGQSHFNRADGGMAST